jgi:anti-sigma regulatory factor (Ser/Thr protein kinase)
VNKLHFHPIRGKALDIIDAILHTEEVSSLGEAYGVIRLVTEELVVNIADYAYPDGGNDFLDVEIERDEKHITLRFCDGGVPFNPLKQPSPDISLPMEQRRIGGLGLLIVIKKMDSVTYEYTDGKNVLTCNKDIEC